MGKGRETRNSILDQAVQLSSEVGLEGLTIGVLAKRVGLSKSGLYAHFGDKEQLQCDVLDAAARRFVDVVMAPAVRCPSGLPRLEKMFELWMKWGREELSGGCPFIGAIADFDDRPGVVRDHLKRHLEGLLTTVARAARIAVDEGHFEPGLDTDHFAFEFWGILVAYHHYVRLLEAPDADSRVERAFAELVARTRGETPEV